MSERQKPEQQKPEQTSPSEPAKVSPAELKKRAKAEKQARRAAQKEQQGDSVTPDQSSSRNVATGYGYTKHQGSSGGQAQVSTAKHQQKSQQKSSDPDNKKQGSTQQGSLPSRARRASQSAGGPAPKASAKNQDNKQIDLFNHLYTQPRRQTAEGTSKDVHPAVIALGFKLSSYEICGSSARCVAMLLAFKEAIQAYTTPTGTSLARHMTPHFLSPQIDFLKSCRPISESMGNAIRWLKKLIAEVDPDTPEQQAKDYLCDSLDKFVQERILFTDQAIAAAASAQIQEGAVVLTYGKSSLVEKSILHAHNKNATNFRVVVVDSRPRFEGKQMATSLMNAGLHVEYLPFSGIACAVNDATLVLLGAHAMLSNGRLQSRVGTAAVAMAAHKADVPVIVCCESIKFSGKVALDSIVLNEVSRPEELLLPQTSPTGVVAVLTENNSSVATSTKNSKERDDEEGEGSRLKSIGNWKDIPNLQLLNIMYDITPAEYIRMIICEYGSVPPTSVPVVHRIANEGLRVSRQ